MKVEKIARVSISFGACINVFQFVYSDFQNYNVFVTKKLQNTMYVLIINIFIVPLQP